MGFLWHCLQQLLWKRASRADKSEPRILRKNFSSLFSAVSSAVFQPWHSNKLFVTEDTVRFQNHFLESCGRTPRSSRLLNCFWILSGRFQAINIFGKAAITVSMSTMFWFQFLRYLTVWIFHSIWWVGRFYRSPFADILKLFQFILRSLATRKIYTCLTSWTLEVKHTHQGFLLFFSNSSLCMLCPSRRHVFRLLVSTLFNHL